MSKRTCEHIQVDGQRCSNPAMYRRRVCYHHWRLLRPSAPVCDPAYVPPTFDCEASVSLVTTQILRSLLAGKIDTRKAQVAMTCVRETAKSLRLQGKAGDHIETSFTAFMADYFSTLDEIQAKSAAAYPDPQPLIYPAHFADLPEDDDPPATTARVALSSRAPAADLSSRAPAADLSSRAPAFRGEGSALCVGEQSARCSNALDNVDTGFQARVSAARAAEKSNLNDSLDNRGRAGLQPRVAGSENVGALAPVPTPQKPPLSTTQLKLMKKILRRGPSHPRFHDAARLLDHQISTNPGRTGV